MMDELLYMSNMYQKYISECENLFKESPNSWSTAYNKAKIKRLGIELRQDMIEFERKNLV